MGSCQGFSFSTCFVFVVKPRNVCHTNIFRKHPMDWHRCWRCWLCINRWVLMKFQISMLCILYLDLFLIVIQGLSLKHIKVLSAWWSIIIQAGQHFSGPNNDSTKWFQVIFWSSVWIWNDPMNTCFANTSDIFSWGGCEPIPTHAIASTKEPCFWHVCLRPSELPSDALENNGLRSRMLSSACFDHINIFYVQLLGLVSGKRGRWVRGRCPLGMKPSGWR